MADQTYEVGIRITATSEDAALQQVQSQLGNVNAKIKESGEAASTASTGMNTLTESVKGLAAGVVGALGIQQLFSIIKEGAMELAREERAMNGTVMMLSQFGGKTDEVRPKVELLKDALEQQGIEGEKTLQVIRTLSPVTQDLDNTLRAAKLAADIATTGIMDYGEAAALVRDLVGDTPRGLMRAHKILGVQATTTQGALDELYGRFRGYSETINDHLKDIDRISVMWGEAKKALASYVVNAIDFYRGNAPQVKEQVTNQQALVDMYAASAAKMKALRDATQKGTEAWRIYNRGMVETLTKLSEAKDKLKELAVAQKVTNPQSAPKVTGAGKEAGGAGAGKGGGIPWIRAAFDHSAEQAAALLIRVRKMVSGELQRMDREDQASYNKTRQNQKRADDQWARAITRTMKLVTTNTKKMTSDELRRYIQELNQEKDYFNKTEQEKLGIAQRSTEAQAQLDKMLTQEKIMGSMMATNEFLGSVGASFGAGKAFGIAQGIINALLAATNAGTKGDPYTTALRVAAALAVTMAQVQAMRGVNMEGGGKGFDNPEHDAMAYAGGQRWATDMVREYSKGISRGWQAGLMGATGTHAGTMTTVHNNQRGPTIVNNNTYMGPSQARAAQAELAKQLVTGERTRARQVLGSKVTKIGRK